jgi:hypothetical protein
MRPITLVTLDDHWQQRIRGDWQKIRRSIGSEVSLILPVIETNRALNDEHTAKMQSDNQTEPMEPTSPEAC